ncbi:MAG: 30S ribosomal protein S10 [bacterium]|nr:30S ribosomal protein S10 [bacterium]
MVVASPNTPAAMKIRVRLKAYDHRVLDEASRKILETALSTGAKIVGPVPLPTHRKWFTVLTSPHTDKNAQEHFVIRTHKRLIDIVNPTGKTIDSLMHLNLPAGVDIQIKM